MEYDYLIVGAGLFGAVFAQEMTARGKKCLVIDRRDHIAGNAYTEDVEGITVHRYGPHIFHTSDETVWAYVNRFADFNNFVNSPLAVFGEELYNLPFNMNTFHQMWGVKTPQEAKQILEKQIAEAGVSQPKNLEEQALSLVGRDVYEKLVKGYTEKQWGRSCTDLPSFIIRRLPVRFTYNNNYFNDTYQGIPKEGYTALVQNLLSGSDVRLNTDYFTDKKTHAAEAKKTVYTGRLDQYFDYRFGVLQYRSVRFETQVLPTDNFQGNALVNYTQREVPYTRIIEHKHFTPEKAGTDALSGAGAAKNAGDGAAFHAASGVSSHGKVAPKTVISREYPCEWEKGDEPYYPVNDTENERKADLYREAAKKEKDVIFGGRLGDYRYLDMDKVILAALRAAKKEE